VADGVVDLKIRAFDRFGNESLSELGRDFAAVNTSFTYPAPGYTNAFGSNAPAGLPNSLQLEVAVLEPEALEQLRALPGTLAQSKFLGNAAGKIQIYRQNMPVPAATR
jgi:hypothetical protein